MKNHGFRVFLAGALFFTTVPLFAGFGSTESYLPAVGRVPGRGGAQFSTTVWASNLTTAPQTLIFQFLKQGQANPSPASFQDTLQPGETKTYQNVIETKLGLTDSIGAARITSTGELFISERISSQAPGDDVGDADGLFFAGIPRDLSISLGQSASIQGISQGGAENSRYNFALVETGGGNPTVNVQVFDASGTLLGQKAYILQAYEQLQPNVAEVVPEIRTTNARITATVTGGTGSALIAGARLAKASEGASGFEMSFRDSLRETPAAAKTNVTSLNGLTGALTLTPGSGISITPSGSQISIAYTGSALTSVTHDESLTGAGTGGSPLAIAAGGVGNTQLAAGAVQSGNVANGQVVRSLNALHDDITLAGGSNVTITPSGSTLTIASGGLTLPYSGSTPSTSNVAFSITAGTTAVFGTANNGVGVLGSGLTGLSAGVRGDSHGSGPGVLGVAEGSSGNGVEGAAANGWAVYGSTANDVYGGVAGVSATSTPGLYGESASGSGIYATSNTGAAVYSAGNFVATGSKSFIEPHPTDPAKEIRYVCLEGPESGTYFRGTERILNGFATIEIPDHFRMVTAEKGLTVVVTPVGGLAVLAAVHQGLDRIVIQGSSDVEFNYIVNGVRKAFDDFEPVTANRDFVPRSAEDDRFTKGLPAESLRRLNTNGILNADGTINLETAHRLGWDRQEGWNQPKPAVPPSREQ